MLTLLKEFWLYMKVRKQYWLLPLLIGLLACSLLILFSQSAAFAPFLYTLF